VNLVKYVVNWEKHVVNLMKHVVNLEKLVVNLVKHVVNLEKCAGSLEKYVVNLGKHLNLLENDKYLHFYSVDDFAGSSFEEEKAIFVHLLWQQEEKVLEGFEEQQQQEGVAVWHRLSCREELLLSLTSFLPAERRSRHRSGSKLEMCANDSLPMSHAALQDQCKSCKQSKPFHVLLAST